MQAVRATFATLAWIYLGLVAFQVFLAGAGVFGASSFEPHIEVGYFVAFFGPLILLIAAAVARAPGTVRLTGALLVLGIVQSILPWLRDGAPYLAALHPVNALLIAFLALTIARRATAAARAQTEAPGPSAAAQGFQG